MATKPEIVVALDAQLEQLVQRGLAHRAARANVRLHFVVIAFSLRKPVRHKRPAQRSKRSQAVRESTARLCLRGRIQREPPLGHAHEHSLDAKPSGKRSARGEEGSL